MSINRIEIKYKNHNPESEILLNKLKSSYKSISAVNISYFYTIDKNYTNNELKKIAKQLINPVVQIYSINKALKQKEFNWAIEIGFLPGVTDNVANTAKQGAEDLLKNKFTENQGIYTSKCFFIKTDLNYDNISGLSKILYNPLIESCKIKSFHDYNKSGGMDITVPKVVLDIKTNILDVDLNVDDTELINIGKHGILDNNNNRRGPLALDLQSLYAIRDYFNSKNRKPTDIELESIAQTWSEHCKHTIFAAKIDEINNGLYKECIKAATQKIRQEKGKNDICVSVFTDNSGGIVFDNDHIITDKVETHNSPSALDPFGGSITGIVGVNRDTIGFGLGAKPIMNRYGFCFASPDDKEPIYKDKELKNKMLSPKRIMEGVIHGVNVGGNCSGIPTTQGFLNFDKRYKGKPLVFVGTVGIMPKKSANRNAWEKSAKSGDNIIMIGGRVGQDGIHGATFSSEALNTKSPATAVQIGDPITQKKLSDAVVKEARDMGLYNSITDNGAGGLSCSVAEMARECGGCLVELDKVPLKYPGLEPWKIWISESQERMTLSVPVSKTDEFIKLMNKRGVEATVIGQFTDSGKCVVKYKDNVIMDVDLIFLHSGLCEKSLTTSVRNQDAVKINIEKKHDYTSDLTKLLSSENITSYDFVSSQYDYEVQGGSVIKPLQGKGKVNGYATVTRPLLNSKRAVAVSHALFPRYGDIDTYDMAACAIDSAVRNIIAVGGTIDHLALLDNFCWCDSNNPERLWQLKRSAMACFDIAVKYGTPFISGKDSMFNDFKGYDKNKKPINISVPPTLLISSIGVIEDSNKCQTIDFKCPDDLVYIIGETKNELGGSEYLYRTANEKNIELGWAGNVPKVIPDEFIKNYKVVENIIDKQILSSCSPVLNGGISVSLAKMAIAGQLGFEGTLDNILFSDQQDKTESILFSETQGRFIVSIPKNKKDEFESITKNIHTSFIGKVIDSDRFLLTLNNKNIIKTNIKELTESYKKTFKDF